MAAPEAGMAEQATMTEEDQLRSLKAEHERLLHQNAKARAELIMMLREDCARLQSEWEGLMTLRQFIRDIQPRDLAEPATAMRRRAEEEAMIEKLREQERVAGQQGYRY